MENLTVESVTAYFLSLIIAFFVGCVYRPKGTEPKQYYFIIWVFAVFPYINTAFATCGIVYAICKAVGEIKANENG